jgi:hypothetical protein
MRVLVCGGRMYGRVADDCPPELLAQERERAGRERVTLYRYLDRHKAEISVVIHGGANGADEWADKWAADRIVPQHSFKADWKAHGRAAGPIRNQRMIDEGKPDLVIAFPGGRGTADMVRRAQAAGIETRELVS